MDALTPPNLGAPGPRRHRHVWILDPVAQGYRCERCMQLRDEGRARAGRNARNRGNRYELRVARDHAQGVKVGHHGGPADVLVGGMFVMQTKRFATARFPSWMSNELAKLPRTGGRVPVLVVGEAAGQGRKGRALAVVDYADWLALHGEAD